MLESEKLQEWSISQTTGVFSLTAAHVSLLTLPKTAVYIIEVHRLWWMDGLVDEWMDGRTDGWMDETL